MDKTSKLIIQELIKGNKGSEYICCYDNDWLSQSDICIDQLAEKLNIRVEDVKTTVRYLVETEFLEYLQTSSGHIIGFHLSHRGLHWKYFNRKAIFDYIANKFPDFIAVIISLISLITSIIALSKPTV